MHGEQNNSHLAARSITPPHTLHQQPISPPRGTAQDLVRGSVADHPIAPRRDLALLSKVGLQLQHIAPGGVGGVMSADANGGALQGFRV